MADIAAINETPIPLELTDAVSCIELDERGPTLKVGITLEIPLDGSLVDVLLKYQKLLTKEVGDNGGPHNGARKIVGTQFPLSHHQSLLQEAASDDSRVVRAPHVDLQQTSADFRGWGITHREENNKLFVNEGNSSATLPSTGYVKDIITESSQ